ncbi:MAG: PEP-CTERM sorting domain-containing protein, partial [Planctomycetota bacterium]|nr:PEP-CTERM sorting domain-containing protein [Planctomycetota bacterium]
GGLISGRGTLNVGGAGLVNNGNIGFSGGFADVYGDVANNAGAKIVISGGSTATFYDDVNAAGGEMRVSSGCSVVFFGTYNGSTTGTGTTYIEDDLRPGHSPAAVSFEGDLVLGSGAHLVAELAGTTPGSQYDQVGVGGLASLDGTLDVVLLGGFAPACGDTFDLFDFANFDGSFDAVNLPALGGGLSWDASGLYSTGQLGVVPEPATLTLVGLGLAASLLRGRKRG